MDSSEASDPVSASAGPPSSRRTAGRPVAWSVAGAVACLAVALWNTVLLVSDSTQEDGVFASRLVALTVAFAGFVVAMAQSVTRPSVDT